MTSKKGTRKSVVESAARMAARTPQTKGAKVAATATGASRARRQAAQQLERTSPATPRRAARIKVRALKMGFDGMKRRRPGDVFLVKPSNFSERWMEEVDADTPIKETGSTEALARRQKEIKALKHASPAGTIPDDAPTGEENIFDDGEE